MRLYYRALRGYSYGSRGFQTTDDCHDRRQGGPSALSRIIDNTCGLGLALGLPFQAVRCVAAHDTEIGRAQCPVLRRGLQSTVNCNHLPIRTAPPTAIRTAPPTASVVYVEKLVEIPVYIEKQVEKLGTVHARTRVHPRYGCSAV